MAKYRKLGRTSSQRKALLRSQVTDLLYRGKIVTTEAKAKEIRKIAEKLIAMAVREKDNFETVTVDAKVAKKDSDGKRVKEVVDGKKVTVYEKRDHKGYAFPSSCQKTDVKGIISGKRSSDRACRQKSQHKDC